MENDYESDEVFEVAGVQKISIEKLRQLTGDYAISDELAETIIDSLYRLSLITYMGNINE